MEPYAFVRSQDNEKQTLRFNRNSQLLEFAHVPQPFSACQRQCRLHQNSRSKWKNHSTSTADSASCSAVEFASHQPKSTPFYSPLHRLLGRTYSGRLVTTPRYGISDTTFT